jgi:hypothetical protein
MSDVLPAPSSNGPRGSLAPMPACSSAARIRLTPEESFPSEVSVLGVGELQVLHSRLCCQLRAEYLRPEGPHPVTLDRHEELVAELGSRESTTTVGTGGERSDH